MRRDVIAGCVGLGISVLLFISSRFQPAYRRVEYSPFLHKPEYPIVDDKKFRIYPASGVVYSTEPTAPQQKNMNSYTIPDVNDTNTIYIDELMQLPLENSGEFINDIATTKSTTIFVKYMRFQITEIRSSETVSIGGFRFLYNNMVVPFEKIQIWNPHTGDSKRYGGEEWSDSDQLSIVFCFNEPLEISQYELKSSYASNENDPTQWKVEGSMNGSFWFMLDDRTTTPTAFPVERNTVVSYLIRV